MASKQVTVRQKTSGSVGSTVEQYAERLEAGILAVMGPAEVGPEVAAAAAVLASGAARVLARSATVMVAADEAHAVELADDQGLRDDRDRDLVGVRSFLVDLRECVTGVYGEAATRAVGFKGPTPEDPVVLVRVAGEVVAGLRREPTLLPKPRFGLAGIDRPALATELEARAARLAAAIEALTKDARENQVTLTARDGAMGAHDVTFSRVANFLTALYALAGEPELADRVRPSPRSPGRLAAETDASASGETPPSDASSSGSAQT
jgi:hypothetical protein